MFVLAESNSLYVGDQIFYLVSFIILALLVWHFAWKPVTQMMQKRADKIANDIDTAQQSHEEAEKLAAQRQAELKGTKAEAAKIVDDAKKSGESQRTQIVETAQQDAQNLKEQARRDADQARENALRGAKDDVANLSIEIASKLIQKQLNADDQQALIDSYIEGLVKHES
ncbi:ATP synthase subunit b [Limosilactobacillus gastricus PS3]|uniref:ATP synthase subunit b n=1 Tax=Limosilactobacillus gastricus PS3 TaxID=1144300 RepID=H4GJ34_9LACO|nr:F0F1 ATP synthase subunit B [Limosilactobacillus gastricus]EHS87059.1 ATP synthase subunit b [Limosilactobacillus gastricus PS3]